MRKHKKKITKMERIDENTVFIEIINTPPPKYNSYNQINIMDKIQELYVMLLKFILKFN